MEQPWWFPEHKNAKGADVRRIVEKLREECSEALEADAVEPVGLVELNERDKEFADALHTVETYFRCRQYEGLDLAELRQAIIQKNNARGYYGEVMKW